jgi:hypothetical protein
MNNGENIPNKRESKEERHLAQLIRRKMITQVEKDKTKYTRKKKHKNDK